MRSWKEQEVVLLSEVDHVVQLTNDHHSHFFLIYIFLKHKLLKSCNWTRKGKYKNKASEVGYYLMFNWSLFHRGLNKCPPLTTMSYLWIQKGLFCILIITPWWQYKIWMVFQQPFLLTLQLCLPEHLRLFLGWCSAQQETPGEQTKEQGSLFIVLCIP